MVNYLAVLLPVMCRFGKLQPTYINIVRDPLDRLASWYYYKRFQQGHRRNMPLEDRIRVHCSSPIYNSMVQT